MPERTRNEYRIDDVLTPGAQEALKHLELFARRMVEGVLHGTHRSKRKGVSTDFDHHKLYQPGDPLKHVDWKASARQDRYVVKRYTEDTALTVRLVVDCSASMLQRTEGAPSKYLQAARMSASLAYLILNQRDRVGLTMTSADRTFWLPASSRETHLVQILQGFATRDAAAGDNLEPCLKTILDRAERRGLIVLVSDLMFDPVPVQRQLARLQAQGHEVLLVHVRDPTEETFPFNRWVMFRDLENLATRHRLDTVPLKKIYREEYQSLMDEWQAWARKYDVHWVTFRTDGHVDTVLSEYLAYRTDMMGKK